MIPAAEIEKDVDLILWSAQLKSVIRYQDQMYWEVETDQHVQSMRPYATNNPDVSFPRAESVAEHTWHMGDMILTIGPRFPQLNLGRCMMLNFMHDKMEIKTGDDDPIGKSGTGHDTHIFNLDKKALKEAREKAAIDEYLQKTSTASQALHRELLLEALELTTWESRFVKAIDKLQPLTFIHQKKQGNLPDEHVVFTWNHTSMSKKYFPEIAPYHEVFFNRLLTPVAHQRHMNCQDLKKQLQLQ